MKFNKIAAISAAAMLSLGGGTIAYATTDDVVESWQPEVTVGCEGWSFSHPAFRHGPTGTQAERYEVQVGIYGDRTAYEPNTVLSGEWDIQTPNYTRITLWAYYPNGKPLPVHQLGQRTLTSYGCPMPESEWIVETRETAPVCVDDASGRSVVYTEARKYEESYEWSGSEWVLQEPVWSDWEVVDRTFIENAEGCEIEEPVTPEEPVVETPEEEVPSENSEPVESVTEAPRTDSEGVTQIQAPTPPRMVATDA